MQIPSSRTSVERVTRLLHCLFFRANCRCLGVRFVAEPDISAHDVVVVVAYYCSRFTMKPIASYSHHNENMWTLLVTATATATAAAAAAAAPVCGWHFGRFQRVIVLRVVLRSCPNSKTSSVPSFAQLMSFCVVVALGQRSLLQRTFPARKHLVDDR